jgi:CRP/FNR family transcriptional regulator, cAMP and macrophage regulator
MNHHPVGVGHDMQAMTPMTMQDAGWLARTLGRGDLAPFTDADLEALAASTEVERVHAGTRLMTEGEPVTAIGIIESGRVELYRRTKMRRVVLQVLREGDVFGDIPFLCDVPPPFSARALTDAAVIRLDAAALHRFLIERPAVCHRFLFSLAARLQRMQGRLLQLTRGNLRQQVATLLLDETEGRVGQVALSQATLAELLGASRPAVNKVLKEFEAAEAVRLGYRQIEVREPSTLSTLASS